MRYYRFLPLPLNLIMGGKSYSEFQERSRFSFDVIQIKSLSVS